MANNSQIKALINEKITTNGTGAITGSELNNVLTQMVLLIGQGRAFAGIATSSGTPSTYDRNVFWLATAAGTYTNFGGLVIPEGLSVILYNEVEGVGSYSFNTLVEIDDEPTSGSDNLVSSGAIHAAIQTAIQAVEQGATEIYDVSGNHSGASYATLAAALALVPQVLQKGGISVKYIDSTSGKYVQYRLLATSWSTNASDWKAAIDERIDEQESVKYIFTIVDKDDKVILGINKDGQLVCQDDFLSLVLENPLSLKVNVSDIVDNLTTQSAVVPLSAKQGYTLKGLIDALNTELDGLTDIFVTNDTYLIAIVDANDNVLWGVKKNGKLDEPARLEDSANWLFTLTDASDKVVFGIKKDGSVYAPGLRVTNYDEEITSLQSGVSALQEDVEDIQGDVEELQSEVSDLQDAIENFEAPDDTVEAAIGKQKSYGTYESELEASPLVDDSSNFNVGYKSIGKDMMLHEPKKMFVVFNHDDGHPADLTATRRIYNKYGFKASLCAVFFPFQTLSYAKTLIPNYRKWLKEGHEIGLHAIMQCSYWFYNRLYDIKPDGSTNFAPLISELKGSNVDGTGTNTFGVEVTADTTIRNAGYGALYIYDTTNLNAKVVEATQAQLDDVNRGLCFYGDRLSLSGIEDLEIEDIMTATSATAVSKTRLQWLEYYYNRLVENVGYSSTSDIIATRFAEDYDYPSGANVDDYYPDAEHLLNGKMVYYGDTTNPHYSDSSYQKVGRFTKGLFKGCFSCCNWEVMDRVVACANAFFRHYYGLNHFTDMHRHGVGYTSLLYVNSGIHYLERSETVLNDCHKKFYVSHRNAWMTTVDIMNEQGIDMLKENVPRTLLDTEGQVGYFFGQKGIKSDRGFGGTTPSMGSYTSYLAMFGTTSSGMETMSYTDFMTFMNGVDNWFKFCYENAGQSVTRNGLTRNIYGYIRDIAREAVGCIDTGKVLPLSVDTINNSPAISMAVDLVLRFFKDNGIEVLSWGAGRDKILSEERNTGGNLFPNAGFNQTLLQYLGGSSSDKDAYIPDGWFYVANGGSEVYSVGVETVNDKSARVFSITGKASIQTNVYGLPQGDYKLCYDVKSSDNGNTEFKYSKIGYKRGVYTTIDNYTHTTEWVTKEVSFSIDAPHRNNVDETNPLSIISDGYEDNVHRLVFRLNSVSASNVLKIANVKLYRI